jgi:hypothetical protein
MDMIKQYSKKADEVVVMISVPVSEKSKRLTNKGKEITAPIAKKIFDLYIKRAKLNNVKVMVSDSPSPVTAAYDYIEKNLSGVNVLLGASDKDGDWKRWSNAAKFVKEHNIDVEIVPPEQAAVKAYKDVSASDIRTSADDLNKVRELLPKELTDNDIEAIQTWLNS